MNWSVTQGDCLELLKSRPSGSVDAVITDPPYGSTDCEWDKVPHLENMWVEIDRVAKQNAAIVMTATQPFTTKLIVSNSKAFRYCWVWVKDQGTGFSLVNKRPLRKHEDVVVFYKSQPFYNSVLEKLDKPRVINRKIGSNGNSLSNCLAVSNERVSV